MGKKVCLYQVVTNWLNLYRLLGLCAFRLAGPFPCICSSKIKNSSGMYIPRTPSSHVVAVYKRNGMKWGQEGLWAELDVKDRVMYIQQH